MDEFFCKIAELADKVTASPFFLIIFNMVLAAVWVLFGTDQANIFISIITAEAVLVTASATRRGNLALHAKLDEIIHAQADARDDLIGLEARPEREIRNKHI